MKADRIDIYLQAISDLPFEGLCAGLESMLLTCKWFPKIPEIREAIIGNPGLREADGEWSKIARRIDSWASRLELEADCYASGFSCGAAKFSLEGLSEPARMVLTRLGGPRAVAATGAAYIPLLKKQFVEEYQHVLVEHPEMKQIEGSTLAGFLKGMDGDEPKQ